MKVVFATGNRNKLKEIQAMVGDRVELSTPADHGITENIPEDQPTLEGNALQKARYIYEKTGLNCFADDTGLEVDALGGEPGVYSARYAAINRAGEGHSSADNMALLLERMEGQTNRRARFRTVIALILDGKEYLFEGQVEGEITAVRAGVDGFGYDPVFRPEGYAETFAEMPLDLKNRISHRGRATAKLIAFLASVLDETPTKKRIPSMDMWLFFIMVGISIYGMFTLREPASKAVFACLLGQALTRQFVTHRRWRIALMVLFTAAGVALIVYSGIKHS